MSAFIPGIAAPGVFFYEPNLTLYEYDSDNQLSLPDPLVNNVANVYNIKPASANPLPPNPSTVYSLVSVFMRITTANITNVAGTKVNVNIYPVQNVPIPSNAVNQDYFTSLYYPTNTTNMILTISGIVNCKEGDALRMSVTLNQAAGDTTNYTLQSFVVREIPFQNN